MKRPFLIVALMYIGGILLGEFVHPPLPFLFATAFVAAFGGIFWGKGRLGCLLTLLILAGWTNMCCHTVILSPNDLRAIVPKTPDVVVIRGTLAQTPVERIYERKQKEMWRSRAFVDVEEILINDVWQPTQGRVCVGTPGILFTEFFSRQHVEISGVINTPRPPLAPGLFDSRTYYKRLGVYYTIDARTNEWSVLPSETPRKMPLADRFHAWAKKTLALGLPKEDKELRLIWTLMLDWKAPMTEVVEEPFVKAGTFHIFAVDGLRIGMISVVFLTLFRVLQIPRNVCGLLILPIIWFYVALTGFPASAVRAGIMVTVVIVGWALKRPWNLYNSLFAAAFIILLWDPQQLFQAGFQLSFLVVLFIALLMKPLDNVVFALFRGDPFLPRQLEPTWLQYTKKFGLFSYHFYGVSLAAWLGGIPLVASYFHLFNPVSIFSNGLVVPLTILSLSCGLGSWVVGGFFPLGAELFNHAGWLLMKWIIALSEWSTDLPGAWWYVSAPGPIVFVGYYLTLSGLWNGWVFRVKCKWAVLSAFLALSIAWVVQFWQESRRTQLHVVPVDGGHAILVDSCGVSDDYLIDCGSEQSFGSLTKPFLAAQGINSLPRFCITHATQRVMGGSSNILNQFSVQQTFTSAAKGRSVVFRRFLNGLDADSTNNLKSVSAGDKIGFWTVLHPANTDHFTTADDNAMVLKAEIKGHSLLFLSDLSRAGQNALLERNPALKADIVIAGLPGKDEPVSDWLLDTVHPRLLIIVDSELPATKRASAALRDRLTQRNFPVIYCREAGAVTLSFFDGNWSVERSGPL